MSENMQQHPKAIERHFQHLVFSKKIASNRDLMQRFNQGLKRLRASGKYQAYFENFRNGGYLIPSND